MAEATTTRKTNKSKSPRNPNFQTESLFQLSWTRVAKDIFPHRRATVCCEERARQGEIVITVPHRVRNETITTAIIHMRCLSEFLKDVPDDMSTIRKKFEEIRSAFITK